MSGGGQTQKSQSTPNPPGYLTKLTKPSAAGWLEGLNAAEAAGGLPSLLTPNPEQIAPLTAGTTADIGTLQSIGQAGSPQDIQTQALIDQLTKGDIGSSPATLAAMRAYTQNIEPTITSSFGATGQGRGGELTAALTQGQTSAYVPLLQQEIANREAGVGQEMQLGAQRQGELTTALQASDLPRQIEQQKNAANFQDFLRRSQLKQQLIMGPLSQFGNALIGGSGTTVTTGSPGKF